MDSALSPREIQSRIRSGASVDDVAAEAGVPTEQVEPFAVPVIAELAHIVETAMGAPVRRHADPGSHRSLGSVVEQVCRSHDLDQSVLSWRCWRHPDRTWALLATWQGEPGPGEGQATFKFDLRGRYSTPQDAGARWLVDDRTALVDPDQDPEDPDQEPTIDLNDELAIVRAVSDRPRRRPGNRRTTRAATERVAGSPAAAPGSTEQASSGETSAAGHGDRHRDPAPEPQVELPTLPGMTATNGVYDFVPSTDHQMDTLYEVLAGFQEDSVNVYEGLDSPPVADTGAEAAGGQTTQGTGDAGDDRPDDQSGTGSSDPGSSSREQSSTEPSSREPADTGRPGNGRGAGAEPSGDEHSDSEQQESQLEEGSGGRSTKPGGRRGRRGGHSKRASVPSWDEIMFGGPTPHL